MFTRHHTYFPHRELSDMGNQVIGDPTTVAEAKAHINGLTKEDLQMLKDPTWSTPLASMAKRRYKRAKHILLTDTQKQNTKRNLVSKLSLTVEEEKKQLDHHEKSGRQLILNSTQFWEDNIGTISSKLEFHVKKLKNPKSLKTPEIHDPGICNIIYTRDSEATIPFQYRQPFYTLEMLGDAVLYHSFCSALMQKYPFLRSHVIGEVRDKLVSNCHLYHCAIEYNLPFAQQLANKGGNKAISDIFEAYVGGLYQNDRDSRRVYDWCSDILDYIAVSVIFREVARIKSIDTSSELKKAIEHLYMVLQLHSRESIGREPVIIEEKFPAALITQLAASDFQL